MTRLAASSRTALAAAAVVTALLPALVAVYLDRKRGDIGGEGFEDVGVWHAAVKRTT
jgi:hypothetical protein